MTIVTTHNLTDQEVSRMKSFKEFLRKKIIPEAEEGLSLPYDNEPDCFYQIIENCESYIAQINALLGESDS